MSSAANGVVDGAGSSSPARSPGNTGQVLVVDDEPDISALVAYHLARESYRVRTAASGPEALEAVQNEVPDLIVLDLMLPGLDGFQVLAELRRRPETQSIPVILLTARRDEWDRIVGLQHGADDYIAKPFSPQELILRVAAVLRRVRQAPPQSYGGKVLRIGPFVVDTGSAHATVRGREVELTATEFRLLATLMERRGRVQTRKQLLQSVWGITASIATRTVDMHVQRLRAKLGPDADWIETMRGFGYRFCEAEPRREPAGGTPAGV